LKDKVVIVTGAFGALGQVVARRLADDDARVALVDAAHAAPGSVQAAHAGELVLSGVDLSDFSAARAMVAKVLERYRRVDGLVNVAGGFRWETIAEGNIDTWDLMYTLNLKTALHACKAALPALLDSGNGRIVNIGAGAASKSASGMGAYTASKAGVLRLTEALAEEGKDRGLNVNAVLPGIIDTPANRMDMPFADFTRWIKPQEVADVVAFLMSNAAQAITGVGIPVTGRL
jgi:NAD(P)-dependent dehydrogenase (short-subunit alcohol dehydrogenase family)